MAAVLVTILGIGAASRLPVRSDLSALLPPSKRSVQDLEAIRQRARAFGNVLVMIEAPTVAVRETAARELEARLRGIDPALVSSVSVDDNAAMRFGWAHRFLFVELADLIEMRGALQDRLARARLERNPLFIDLDDDSASAAGALTARVESLERRLDAAERMANSPPMRLSPDRKSQLFVLDVTFSSSDVVKGRTVMSLVRQIGRDVAAQNPGVEIEYAGNVNITIFEHESVISGMARSAVITLILVMLGLFWYYRATFLILAALWSLVVGVAATLLFSWLSIGHLNLLSAFLTAIVIGNGINPALIVLAHYAEELRASTPPQLAIEPALRGSLHGTLGASLAAAVAFGALIVTDFRGFRHFGIIGGVGMVLCWLSAFTVLPATLDWLAQRGLLRSARQPRLGQLVARLGGARTSWVLAIGAMLTALSVAVTVIYVVRDPFEKDWRDLQSDAPQITAQRLVDQRMSARFDRGVLGGHSYQLVIAVDAQADVRTLVAILRAIEAKRPEDRKLFVDIKSIDDLVPPDQAAKLVVLADLRRLLADPVIAQLAPEERARLARLVPPADLRQVTVDDVPADLLRPFVEQDGTIGRLIYVKGSPRFQTWNVDDRVAFAAAVRQLPITRGVLIGGEPLVIADIVESMKDDAPLMIAVALLGAMVVVWLTVGWRRHGAITLGCGLAGVFMMIALCAAVGIKVHFLDLIALPITIGIGIDYAINLAARDRRNRAAGIRELLSNTGSAVVMCSYTTVIGYGSLLLSSNGGLRAFGLAAILGEISCLGAALLIAPALLSRAR